MPKMITQGKREIIGYIAEFFQLLSKNGGWQAEKN